MAKKRRKTATELEADIKKLRSANRQKDLRHKAELKGIERGLNLAKEARRDN